MIIKIHGENFKAEPNFTVIGYMGEHNARVIDITQPTVEGAESYVLRFEYPDGVKYDVPIEDGKVTVTASLLRVADDVRCQWIAAKPNSEGSYDIVAKSQIFTLTIKPSIGDDVAPIPTYEQAQSMLDQLNEGINSKITAPKVEGKARQVLTSDGEGKALWADPQGGGSGESGATFTPSVSAEGVISWTNDKDLPNPEPVNIKGPQGERGLQGEQGVQGERGEKGEKGDTGEQGIQGEKGDKGDKGDTGAAGANGQDGYTPVRGVDFWTGEDIAAINTHNDSYVDTKFAEKEQDISNSVRRAEQAASSASQSATNADTTKAEVEAIVYEDVVGDDMLAGVAMTANVRSSQTEQEDAPFITENYDYIDSTENYNGYLISDAIEMPNGRYRFVADRRCYINIDLYDPYLGCYDNSYDAIASSAWEETNGRFVYEYEVDEEYEHNYVRLGYNTSQADWQSYGVELRAITRGSKIIADVHDYIQEHKDEFKGEKGEKGADGQDYILTQADKQEIAEMVVDLIPSAEEVSY